MKKLISLLLVICICISTSACSKEKDRPTYQRYIDAGFVRV